jgi:fibronectin-binding autotransporter adhesin
MNLRRFIGIATAALALGVPGAHAQSFIWTGPTSDTNWTTPGNWNLGVPPQGVGTNLFFGPNNPTAFTSTVDTNYTVGSAEVTGAAGPFTLNNSGSSVLTIDSTFWNFSANPVAINAPIAGGGVLFLMGTGSVTLGSLSNTYSGLTRVTNGTLTDGAPGTFSPNSVVTIASPGILSVAFNETIAGLSDDFSGGNGTVTVANNQTLTIAGPSITTFSGAITGLGGLQLNGPGMLTVSGANTYGGPTTLNGGTLADSAPNSFSLNSTVTLAGSATLNANDDETVAGLQGAGGTVNIGSGATLTLSTPNNPVFSGLIAGAGGLIIGGTGTQTLSGMSTYSGGTVVQSELFVGSSTNGPPSSFTAGPVGTGPLTFVFMAEFSPAANVTIANAIVFNDDVQYVDNDDGGSFNMTLTGAISGSSGFAWCTPGVLELTGANTFLGGVDMREGTLLLGSSTVGPPTGIVSGPIGTGGLTLDSGTVLAAALPSVTLANAINLTGNTQIGAGPSDGNALSLTGQITGSGIITYSAGASGTLTLGGANSYIGDTMVDGGTVIAANDIAFGNAGNHIVLDGGGLDVASTAAIGNTILGVGSANPVSGSGTITSHLTIDSTFDLSPGDPLGTLTFSNGLKLAPNGTMTFKLYDAGGAPGTGWGFLNVSAGNLNITASSGMFAFNVTTIGLTGNSAPALNFNASSAYSWEFATAANPIAGFNASDFTLNTTGFANATSGGFFSLTETGNNLFLNFTPVPEPTTWSMTALGIAVLSPFAISRRRRRRMRA